MTDISDQIATLTAERDAHRSQSNENYARLMEMRAERDDARAELAAALKREEGLRDALKPFSEMAGELIARNWNRIAPVLMLDNPDDPHRIYAGDFFAARSALVPKGE